MKQLKHLFFILIAVLSLQSCVALRTPVVVSHSPVTDYKYAYLSNTKELTSSAAVSGGNVYGVYGSAVSKSVNPSDVISGILIKNGFIILPELKPEFSRQTLVVNYGESGRRNVNLGYSIEVTIQFLSAATSEVVCVTSAEGQGETEADDIREAITRALTAVFSPKK